MESAHGVDVSWMTQRTNNAQKDNHSKSPHHQLHHDPQSLQSLPPVSIDETPSPVQNGNAHQPADPAVAPPKPAVQARLGLKGAAGPLSPPPRRPSWLSSFSSKFSSSSNLASHNTTSPASPQPPASEFVLESPVPAGPHSPKNVMLPHVAKSPGDEPYTPAPVRSTQGGFLQSALRRLSSSGPSGGHSAVPKASQHGLCQRMVLNVDHHRERCQISELSQSKLRRVAFCVDVEIASGSRHYDDIPEVQETDVEVKERKRSLERREGVALKHTAAHTDEKGDAGVKNLPGSSSPSEPGKGTLEVRDDHPTDKDTTKKKEKKKRSEEERKARKEKKRKQAEENGSVPVEVVRELVDRSDSSGGSNSGSRPPKTQASPTTDPVRIYRRCCQLRETPILKKITEQLSASVSAGGPVGVVNKLDLTGYWLHLSDLVTLGDYFAVVPVNELILEDCGLTDEGARVILAGLLAAKPIDRPGRQPRHHEKTGEVVQGGVIGRLVLKNNPKIGRDGWRHICLFINMCRSLKSLDLSKIPFPQVPAPATPNPTSNDQLTRTSSASSSNTELSQLLGKSVGERLAGSEFELLVLAECGIATDQLGDIVDGLIKSGLRRFGLAGNDISPEGMKHIARYIREGNCDGLDLGGNDLKDQLQTIAEALGENCSLYALSLADCNLSPDSLRTLFPALAKLDNFRFIDLSQNHDLFEADPSALSLLRRYLPKMRMLRRIHLADVSMTPEQAIALAEILPDTPCLAHINIMDNPKLVALATAKDEANQEEACALYASLMAAVRVSKTIICIDIEVPSNDMSEIVKALAKQVVAYCLWNMERGAVAEISEAVNTESELDPDLAKKSVAIPDVLLHLVGHVEGAPDFHDEVEPAPDEDYVIGGTGVVKALGICLLNRGNDARRTSSGRSSPDVSRSTDRPSTPTETVTGGKAKQMSKNLLGGARRIRARLQPALMKEARENDQYNYLRLHSLDNTLRGMIKRFEDEFPETRLHSGEATPSTTGVEPQISPCDSIGLSNIVESQASDNEQAAANGDDLDVDYVVRPVISRHNSDVSIASKALSQEEGRMHRFGQKLRRDIINPDGPEQGSSNDERLGFLRAMIDGLGGEELQKQLQSYSHEKVLEELSNEASVLRKQLIDSDPEGWKKFVESQEAAERNIAAHNRQEGSCGIE